MDSVLEPLRFTCTSCREHRKVVVNVVKNCFVNFERTGLFHKAIMQSGCALNPWVSGVVDSGRILGKYFCRLEDDEAEILDYLLKEDVSRLCLAQSETMNVSVDGLLESYVYLIVECSGFK